MLSELSWIPSDKSFWFHAKKIVVILLSCQIQLLYAFIYSKLISFSWTSNGNIAFISLETPVLRINVIYECLMCQSDIQGLGESWAKYIEVIETIHTKQ